MHRSPRNGPCVAQTGALHRPSMSQDDLERRRLRAAAYLRKLGPAIEGQGGDDHTFRCCKVGVKFDLEEDEFLPVLEDWNSTCSPPWRSDELARKLRATYRNTTTPRGVALERDDEHRDRGPRQAPATPSYPPAREVTWLWQTAEPGAVFVRGQRGPAPDNAASRWVRRMQLEPEGLGIHPELQVRAMPGPKVARDFWPLWGVTREGRWCDSGYGALLPLFDAAGALRSFKARWTVLGALDEETGEVVGAAAPGGMKSVGPFGFDLRGLVMCNAQALHLLMTGAWEESTPRDQRELWLAEGEPDFLVCTYRLHNSLRPARACMGLFAGAWTPEIAARVPGNSIVVNAQDPDRGGDKIAELVQRTLQGRCTIKRFDARRLKT